MEKKIVDVTPVDKVDLSCYSKFLNSIMFKLGLSQTIEQCIHGYKIYLNLDCIDPDKINNLVEELWTYSSKTFSSKLVFAHEEVPEGVDKKSVEYIFKINNAEFLVQFIHDVCSPEQPYSDLVITKVRKVLEHSPFNKKLPLYQGIFLINIAIETGLMYDTSMTENIGIDVEWHQSSLDEDDHDLELSAYFTVPLMLKPINAYFMDKVVENLFKENLKLKQKVY